MSRKIKNAIAHGIECKMNLICTNGKLVSKALNIQLEAREQMFKTLNEIHRQDNELPRCPPVCLETEITGEIL